LLANKLADPVVLEKQITSFFTTLDVVGLSIGNIRRLMQGGYNSVSKILDMRVADYMKLEGFKEKMSQKIYDSVQDKVKNASLVKIMAASGVMGRGMGEKKLKPIIEDIPTILTSRESSIQKYNRLLEVANIGKENAKLFVENIPHMLSFLQECHLEYKLEFVRTTVETGHVLSGKKVLFTGFRDKPYMEALEKQGVQFVSTINKNVFMVVIKDENETNAKTEKAVSLNIPIMTITEFKTKY
jgi:hypothetical protein